jgi:hypothetical protein
VVGLCEDGNEISGPINGVEFLHQMKGLFSSQRKLQSVELVTNAVMSRTKLFIPKTEAASLLVIYYLYTFKDLILLAPAVRDFSFLHSVQTDSGAHLTS